MIIAVGVIAAVLAALLTTVIVQRVMTGRAHEALDVIESSEAPSHGDVMRRAGRLADAQQQRLDEAALRLAWMTATLDVVNSAVLVYAEDGTVVSKNRAADHFEGARHGEALVGNALRDLVGDALHGDTAEEIVELVGPPRRQFQIRTNPIIVDSDVRGAVALIDDVSERLRIDHVRRDFVANVSHELKTPIGALSLLAETLADDTGDDPEVSARLADRIHLEARRIAGTVDDLMALSRIEDTGSVDYAEVDMNEVVDTALERIAVAAGQFGVALDRSPFEQPMVVRGQRVQLESAVFNLVDNAVKYSDSGSTVEVRLARGDGVVAIAVQDQGVGIPAGDLDRIFERFYRVDKARSRVTGGTGLGLSIVHHVVRNHDGELQVTSREGEGSTFSILLPDAHAGVDERSLDDDIPITTDDDHPLPDRPTRNHR